MKNARFTGLVALLPMALFACASQAEPPSTTEGEQRSTIDGAPSTSAPAPGVTPAPGPTPAPAPVPVAGCTPLAKPSGGVNPAAAYCSELGFQLAAGQCAFPDGTSCEQWSFYRGECGQAHSFCNLHGGTVANKVEDMGTWTASYASCTLPTGKTCEDASFAQTCTCE